MIRILLFLLLFVTSSSNAETIDATLVLKWCGADNYGCTTPAIYDTYDAARAAGGGCCARNVNTFVCPSAEWTLWFNGQYRCTRCPSPFVTNESGQCVCPSGYVQQGDTCVDVCNDRKGRLYYGCVAYPWNPSTGLDWPARSYNEGCLADASAVSAGFRNMDTQEEYWCGTWRYNGNSFNNTPDSYQNNMTNVSTSTTNNNNNTTNNTTNNNNNTFTSNSTTTNNATNNTTTTTTTNNTYNTTTNTVTTTTTVTTTNNATNETNTTTNEATQDGETFCQQNPLSAICKTTPDIKSGAATDETIIGQVDGLKTAVQGMFDSLGDLIANARDAVLAKLTSIEEKLGLDPCTDNPERLGCLTAGNLDTPGLDVEIADFSEIQPEQVSVPESCPPDVSFTIFGRTYSISYAPVCELAVYIKPLVLLAASISALFIFLGAFKS